jgi:hypothetical protein
MRCTSEQRIGEFRTLGIESHSMIFIEQIFWACAFFRDFQAAFAVEVPF